MKTLILILTLSCSLCGYCQIPIKTNSLTLNDLLYIYKSGYSPSSVKILSNYGLTYIGPDFLKAETFWKEGGAEEFKFYNDGSICYILFSDPTSFNSILNKLKDYQISWKKDNMGIHTCFLYNLCYIKMNIINYRKINKNDGFEDDSMYTISIQKNSTDCSN